MMCQKESLKKSGKLGEFDECDKPDKSGKPDEFDECDKPDKSDKSSESGESDKPRKTTIRLAGVVRESIVDGPGIRFTVFCQGCPHHCQGCHNPETHDFEGGNDCSIEKLLTEIDKNPLLSGVTFSGGEPMCQAEAFLELAREIKKRKLNIVVFSGYTFEELQQKSQRDEAVRELLELSDYLIDGKFIFEERDLQLSFRGSRNQRYINLKLTREAGQIVLEE